MNKKYLSSGEGYWYNAEDPSQGCAGLPPEIEESINVEWEKKYLSEEHLRKSRIAKAKQLINKKGVRDISYKINFLENLGYGRIKVRGKIIDLRKAAEIHPKNVYRMYNRVLMELEEFIRFPKKESNLIEKLDYFQ